MGNTIGEVYGPAMAVTDQASADAYFEALVARHLAEAPADGRAKAELVQRMSLGYFAGYYDDETRARAERLFKCSHPIFGPIAEGVP